MEMRFEVVTAENVGSWVEIQNKIFPESAVKKESIELFFKKGPGACGNIMSALYLVYVDEVLSGVCGLYIPLGVEEHKSIWLSWFGLLPTTRGAGLGRKLLDHCVELAKGFMKEPYNVKYFRLYTTEFVNVTAQPLYNKAMELKEYYSNEEMFGKGFIDVAKNAYPGLSEEDCKKMMGKAIAIFSKRLDPEHAILVPWGNRYMGLSQALEYEEDQR